jgi:Na+:H+ antiporter, NhaA family
MTPSNKTSRTKKLSITAAFRDFFQSQQASGIILVAVTAASLFISNSIWGNEYRAFWDIHFGTEAYHLHLNHSITDWINDALMAIFFLLVGIEIKRELLDGELSDRKRAMLPLFGALGGMAVPALIFFLFNMSSPETLSGVGIPTATDIAFAIAILGLLGNRVPAALKVFLTALAIIDDLGAILLIAVFYGQGVHWAWLGASALIVVLMYVVDKINWDYAWLYITLGIALWFTMMHSGIHATLSGVILALMLPRQSNKEKKMSNQLEHALSGYVSFLILPLFAAANTAIKIDMNMMDHLVNPLSLGIFFGLFLGKPIGIVSFSWLADKLGIAQISRSITFTKLLGAGLLGGIGFTMSIFVANLAFNDRELIDMAKLSIIIASITAAVMGYWLLSKSKDSGI